MCETVYHQKNVTEVQPTCKTVMMPMCMKNPKGEENCVQIPRKVKYLSSSQIRKKILRLGHTSLLHGKYGTKLKHNYNTPKK